MSAGIKQFDSGVLQGNSWHMNPQFIHQDIQVTIDQVRKVFGWEMEKLPLFFTNKKGEKIEIGEFALVRKDTQHILVPSVGGKFTAIPNDVMIDIVQKGILAKFPDLSIEGAMTLDNNSIGIVRMIGGEFQVKGDNSPQKTRMCFVNPLGKGSYTVFVHNERVVCANTLRVATAEGVANKTVKKFGHYRNAMDKVNIAMEEIAEYQLGLKKHVEILNMLTKVDTSAKMIETFLSKLIPIREKDSDVLTAHSKEKRDAILAQFNTDQDLKGGVATSAYGLLQAVTYWIDHKKGRASTDPAARQWDDMTGKGMEFKENAFNLLTAKI